MPLDYPVFTDRQLVALFVRGDEAAFEALFRRHFERVYRVTRRFVRRDADAEEICQEVFLRVARGAAAWRPEAKFTTWLYRVAVNTSLSRRRREDRRHLVLLPDAATAPDPGAAVAPFEAARGVELTAALERALATLPGRLAAVFQLRVLEDLSVAETAAALEIPAGTVKTHLHRARAALRVRLRPHLDPGDDAPGAAREETSA